MIIFPKLHSLCHCILWHGIVWRGVVWRCMPQLWHFVLRRTASATADKRICNTQCALKLWNRTWATKITTNTTFAHSVLCYAAELSLFSLSLPTHCHCLSMHSNQVPMHFYFVSLQWESVSKHAQIWIYGIKTEARMGQRGVSFCTSASRWGW